MHWVELIDGWIDYRDFHMAWIAELNPLDYLKSSRLLNTERRNWPQVLEQLVAEPSRVPGSASVLRACMASPSLKPLFF